MGNNDLLRTLRRSSVRPFSFWWHRLSLCNTIVAARLSARRTSVRFRSAGIRRYRTKLIIVQSLVTK